MRRLAKFPGLRVLVVGELGVDKFIWGTAQRLSPEAPVPVVEVSSPDCEEERLGVAANVARNLLALEASCVFCGVVGSDATGRRARSLMEACGLSTDGLVTDRGRPTVHKIRVIAGTQHVVRVDYEQRHPISPRVARRLLSRVRRLGRGCHAVILEDYGKGVLTDEVASGTISFARRMGVPVAVDPNRWTPLERYRGATLITPNRAEAAQLTGIDIVDEASLSRAGHRIIDSTGCEACIITLDKEGMAVFEQGRRSPVRVPTRAREVFDVSGAGDTAVAVLTLARCAGADWVEAATLANFASGIVVGKLGTATASRQEVSAAIRAA